MDMPSSFGVLFCFVAYAVYARRYSDELLHVLIPLPDPKVALGLSSVLTVAGPNGWTFHSRSVSGEYEHFGPKNRGPSEKSATQMLITFTDLRRPPPQTKLCRLYLQLHNSGRTGGWGGGGGAKPACGFFRKRLSPVGETFI
jgi:hypothetical protein